MRQQNGSGNMLMQKWLAIMVLSGVLFAMHGCGSEGNHSTGSKAVQSYVDDQNQSSRSIDSKTKQVSLTLTRVGPDTFQFSLLNKGSRLTVIQPKWLYSVRMHFFDRDGQGITPRTLQAVNLPALLPDSVMTLTAGQELTGNISKADILEMYGGLETCSLVSPSYLPSEFAVETAGGKALDLARAPVWANALEW